MRTIATGPEARLTYLKRQLVKSHNRLLSLNKNTCSYLALARKIFSGEIIIVREIRKLEDEG